MSKTTVGIKPLIDIKNLSLDTKTNKPIVFLELGVGDNTPGIIKFPFWQMTFNNPDAIYIAINQGEADAPKQILDRSILINVDIKTILNGDDSNDT